MSGLFTYSKKGELGFELSFASKFPWVFHGRGRLVKGQTTVNQQVPLRVPIFVHLLATCSLELRSIL